MKTIAQQKGITKFPYEEFDSNGNIIYFELPEGRWWKRQYDSNGNQVYFENSNGLWTKREYDSKGFEIYYEDSSGFWWKSEYDSKGNEIYFENSNGEIIDHRPNQPTLTQEQLTRLITFIQERISFHSKVGEVTNDPTYHAGAVMELIGIEERINQLLNK